MRIIIANVHWIFYLCNVYCMPLHKLWCVWWSKDLLIKRFIFHKRYYLLLSSINREIKIKLSSMLKASFFVFIKAPAPLEVLYLEFIFICEQQKNVRLHFLLWKMKDFRFIPLNIACFLSKTCFTFPISVTFFLLQIQFSKKQYFILKIQLKNIYWK